MGRPALRTEVFFGKQKFAVLTLRHGSAAKVFELYRSILYPTIKSATRLSMLVAMQPAREDELDVMNELLLEAYWKPLWHLRKVSGGKTSLTNENARAAAYALGYDPDLILEDLD